MADSSGKDTLLCGRDFTEQDLWVVKETVRRFPRLSQTELAHTICENLQWVAPNGNNKVDSCRLLLRKLESQGMIKLPAKRNSGSCKDRRIIPTQQTDAPAQITADLSQISVQVKHVSGASQMRLWNEYVERYHYLGYKRPFGAHQRYFIHSHDEQLLGCILFAASAWALDVRDQWIGWTKTDRSKRLHLVVSNTRFLIFPWVKVKNLASKALSLAVRQVSADWQEQYGFKPVLLETFVDEELYQGTCYQAANWLSLGQTTGRGRMDRYHQHLSSPKRIYMYPLHRDFRAILRGESGDAK